MKIDIICPLYNAELFLDNLYSSIRRQKKVNNVNINFLVTKSEDNTEKKIKKMNLKYCVIDKSDFSHSLTREEAAKKSKADIIVFITQDIIIKSDFWLYELVNPIEKGEVVATYSRQISKYDNIEKYVREFNYPSESKVVCKNDINKLGLKTFFYSDVSSAIRRDVFESLNYYDRKKLALSEDMYIAYKLIMNNYKIKYCANSIVYHSHKYKLKELYNRYKLTGSFFKENSYLSKYGTNSSGIRLATYILSRIIHERNFKLLVRYPFDMLMRFLGMKIGSLR